jgi:D-glycero-alpha-D-manno-heptose-7-phosphate kinase
MIISRTPYRISFFGGGTDYPGWYREHGGATLVTTINKYCYLSCRYFPPFFDHRYRIVYSKIESCSRLDEIAHPAVRSVLRYLNFERGVVVQHDGDLPARSGMGSSSSFTVGLLHALYALRGIMPSQKRLSLEAIHVEQDINQETIGSQDQVAVAYGGLNHLLFLQNGEIVVRPVILPRARLREFNAYCMLFYTGVKRTASDVASSYVPDIGSRGRQLRVMGDLLDESLNILSGGEDLRKFGALLHEAWQIKRSLSPLVTNTYVDDIYEAAIRAGALGGKLLGAGGGGFMLLFAPPEAQTHIKEALCSLIHVPFEFEYSGSQIIFNDDSDEDYADLEKMRSSQPIQAFQELKPASTTGDAP